MIDLKDFYPEFLRSLDSDPDGSKSRFYAFARAVYTTKPPRILLSLPDDEREDVFQDLCVKCLQDDCKVLRSYVDRSIPFSALLLLMMHRFAINKIRARIDAISLVSGDIVAEPIDPDWARTMQGVEKCLGVMTEVDRVILRLLAEQYTPKEIADELAGAVKNRKASIYEQIDTARRRLAKCVEGQGISLDDILGQ